MTGRTSVRGWVQSRTAEYSRRHRAQLTPNDMSESWVRTCRSPNNRVSSG